ncbi:Mur ligase family protein [Xenophilus azovorans]|uniref:Mur ligase family protein n=1 Tax=Xenophilus azovorans TaxID=151755 RepID=UPI00068CFBA4|nr:UDP-N-acetylmuramoyl-L-alanine--D-glutamate ligase [Xenophilus azovorans]
MKHLQDLHVLVLGLGASGLAMARWCARHGAQVTVADTREAPPQLAVLREQLPQVKFVGGPFSAALVEGTPIRAVYRSPGLSPAAIAPVADAARAIGLPVGGELDLFVQALADLREADETPQADEVPEAEAPAEAQAEEAPAAAEPAPASDDEAPAPVIAPPPAETGYRPAVLAVTGTNGKTTVTSLTGLLVERAGRTVAVAGNIGPSLLDTLAERMDAGDLPQAWVLELSSFQLDGVRGFEPTAATALNITQDHLDWHGDMAAYAAAKARIFGERGLMVLNRDDEAVMAMLPPPVRAKLQRPQQRAHVTFGSGLPQRPGDFGIERVNGMAWLVRAHEADETQKRKRGAARRAGPPQASAHPLGGQRGHAVPNVGASSDEEEIHLQRLMPADALRIRGQHNAMNALAALALAVAAGCPLAPMLYGLREYAGEPHRVEPVALVDDIEFFDDSKGTNVGATAAALLGLGGERSAGPPQASESPLGGQRGHEVPSVGAVVQRRIVLIAGGEGKGQDFGPLAEPVGRYARAVVLIGRDAPILRAALEGTGVPLLDAASMDEAVLLAARRAQPGDAVLLSPACASFDMFRDYAHRAEVFRGAVQALADDPAPMREGAAAPVEGEDAT